MKLLKIFFIAILLVLSGFQTAHFLNDHNDVSVSGSSVGDLLTYNGSGWTNSPLSLNTGGTLFFESGAITDFTEHGTVSDSTDLNGDVFVNHGLGSANITVITQLTDTLGYITNVYDKTDSNFAVRFYEINTTPSAIDSVPVVFDWQAKFQVPVGPLDLVSGASRAFSVRRTRTSYDGPLMRIRRSSDDAEADFYPDLDGILSLNSLNGSSVDLSTWISTDNGFVTIWYDQSLFGADASNSTTTEQPQVVSSGSLVTEGGVVAIDFDGSNDYLLMTAVSSVNMTILAVFQGAAGASDHIMLGGTTDYFTYKTTGTNHRARFGGGQVDFTSPGTTAHQLLSAYRSGVNGELFQSGVSLGTTSSFNSGAASFQYIGRWQTASFNHNGTIQEVIFYSDNESSNREILENNILIKYGLN